MNVWMKEFDFLWSIFALVFCLVVHMSTSSTSMYIGAHTQTICWKIWTGRFLIIYHSPVRSWPLHAGLKQWTQRRSDTLSALYVFSGTWETLHKVSVQKATKIFAQCTQEMEKCRTGHYKTIPTLVISLWNHQTRIASVFTFKPFVCNRTCLNL